jgi:hypothetical protein
MAVLTALDLEREAHHVWRQDRVYREEPGGRMQVHLREVVNQGHSAAAELFGPHSISQAALRSTIFEIQSFCLNSTIVGTLGDGGSF